MNCLCLFYRLVKNRKKNCLENEIAADQGTSKKTTKPKWSLHYKENNGFASFFSPHLLTFVTDFFVMFVVVVVGLCVMEEAVGVCGSAISPNWILR